MTSLVIYFCGTLTSTLFVDCLLTMLGCGCRNHLDGQGADPPHRSHDFPRSEENIPSAMEVVWNCYQLLAFYVCYDSSWPLMIQLYDWSRIQWFSLSPSFKRMAAAHGSLVDIKCTSQMVHFPGDELDLTCTVKTFIFKGPVPISDARFSPKFDSTTELEQKMVWRRMTALRQDFLKWNNPTSIPSSWLLKLYEAVSQVVKPWLRRTSILFYTTENNK